eukprot:1180789-Pleurochrysis_carterae.AAC.1
MADAPADSERAAWPSLPPSNDLGSTARSPRSITHALSVQGMLLPFAVVYGFFNVQQRRSALAPG